MFGREEKEEEMPKKGMRKKKGRGSKKRKGGKGRSSKR